MFFSHNLEPKMQGLLNVKEIYIKKKRSRGIFVRENLKNNIVIKNVIWSEKKTFTHKAERPNNYFVQFFRV